MPRRSIAESLSAREIKFLKAPLVEKPNDTAITQELPEKKPPANSSLKPDSPERIKPVSRKRQPSPLQPDIDQQPWVTITTRLPNRLHARLRRVAFERGERGEQPSKIQDILAQAALRWLEENEPNANKPDRPANNDG